MNKKTKFWRRKKNRNYWVETSNLERMKTIIFFQSHFSSDLVWNIMSPWNKFLNVFGHNLFKYKKLAWFDNPQRTRGGFYAHLPNSLIRKSWIIQSKSTNYDQKCSKTYFGGSLGLFPTRAEEKTVFKIFGFFRNLRSRPKNFEIFYFFKISYFVQILLGYLIESSDTKI